MKQPVAFYGEGVRPVGDVYYPDDLSPGEKRPAFSEVMAATLA